MAINTYFQNIANAIRTKTGSAGLITPAEMPDEILSIPAGGITPLVPLYKDFLRYYVNGSNWINDGNVNNHSDIYLLNDLNGYYFVVTQNTVGRPLRVLATANDPTTGNMSGLNLLEVSENNVQTNCPYTIHVTNATYPYLIVYKGYQDSADKIVNVYSANDLFFNALTYEGGLAYEGVI